MNEIKLIEQIILLSSINRLTWTTGKLKTFPPTYDSKHTKFYPFDDEYTASGISDYKNLAPFDIIIIKHWTGDGQDIYSLLIFQADSMTICIRESDLPTDKKNLLATLYQKAETEPAIFLAKLLRNATKLQKGQQPESSSDTTIHEET